MTENYYRKFKLGGPHHDFLVLKADEYYRKGYGEFIHDERSHQLPDDFLMYFYDMLLWIPTLNPGNKNKAGFGLNLYGPTLITSEGAQVAAVLFQNLARLFSLAPEQFQLSAGSISPELDELTDEEIELFGPEGPKNYLLVKYEVERDKFLPLLERLSKWAKQVAESQNSYVLLHIGI